MPTWRKLVETGLFLEFPDMFEDHERAREALAGTSMPVGDKVGAQIAGNKLESVQQDQATATAEAPAQEALGAVTAATRQAQALRLARVSLTARPSTGRQAQALGPMN